MLTNENQNTEYGHYLIIKDLNVAAWCLQFTEKVVDHDIMYSHEWWTRYFLYRSNGGSLKFVVHKSWILIRF